MDLTVNVKLDATDKLIGFVNSLLALLPKKVEKAEAVEVVAEPVKEVKKETKTLKKMKEENPALGKLVDNLDLVETYPTVKDVRDAMDAVRARIEVDALTKEMYHKPLTSEFKLLAAELGSEKPSELPEDKRQIFIDETKLLIIKNGVITKKEAF